MPDISSLALKYQGAGYQFGGSPATGIGHWDCSSFVNWVVGHDAGMAIPGYAAGAYTGVVHGPVVLQWATWAGAATTKSPVAGTLCVWPGLGALGHMGIYLADNKMISALNSQQGTVVTPISGYGPAGVALVYRNISGVTSPGLAGSVSGCVPGSTTAVMLYALFCGIKRGRYIQSGKRHYAKGLRETHD